MSSKDQNLSKVEIVDGDFSKSTVGVVVSQWNADITQALEDGSIEVLQKAGITEDRIHTIKVPGSFELPHGARILLDKYKMDAVICLGCVVKGETKHDDYINHAIASGITNLSLMKNVPIIFGVLTTNTMEQAKERSGGKYGNKGVEAANSALSMIQIRSNLNAPKSKIGFV